MATIRGLTIEIGATTTKLGTELKKIKDQSSGISGELRTVDKLLKFESGDKTELLKRRLEAVEKAASEVKKEIDLYTKGLDANKKAVDAGEISQEQYEKNVESLNKQLNTAKNRYEVLQAELGDTARKLEETSRGTDENADSLQEMGDAADDAGKKSISLGDLIKGNLISGAILGGLKSVVGLIQNLASAAWNAVKKTAEAVITYGKEAIDLAASFQDSLGYSDQIFGDWYEDVTKFVDDNTLALRSNKAELLENVNTFGALFRASGMGRDKAYQFSTALIKLASDMRAATGIPLDQVIQNLQSVMTGGAEAGYKYGLVVKDTEVKLKALQMGLVQTTIDMTDVDAANLKIWDSQRKLAEALKKGGEGSYEYQAALQKVKEAEEALDIALEGKEIALTEAQKQEARYALIMEQSATMQGQATRESGNYKSQLDLMRTTLDNLKIDIGEKLLPVVNEIISEANAFFQSEEGKQLLEDLTTGIGNVATSILNFLQSDDFKKFKDKWIPKIETFISNLITNLPGVVGSIGEICGKIGELIDWFERLNYATKTDEEKRALALKDMEEYAGKLGLSHKQMTDSMDKMAEAYGVEVDDILLEYYAYESGIKETMDNAKAHLDGGFEKQEESFRTNQNSVAEYAASVGISYADAATAIGKYAEANGLNVAEMLSDWEKYKDDSIFAMNLAATGLDDCLGEMSTSLDIGKEDIKTKNSEIESSFSGMADKVGSETSRAKSAMQTGVDGMGDVSTAKFTEKVSFIESLVGSLKSLWDSIWDNDSDSPASSGNRGLQGRASGGSVIANIPYRVGENGPEIFVPRVNGTIINAPQTQAIMSGQDAAAVPQNTQRQAQQDQIINLTVPQIVYLDGEVVYKNQQKIQQRKGVSLIVGRATT